MRSIPAPELGPSKVKIRVMALVNGGLSEEVVVDTARTERARGLLTDPTSSSATSVAPICPRASVRRDKGRLVGEGRLGGADGILDMEAVALKRLRLLRVTFRTRDAAEKADVVAALRAETDLGNEALRPTIDRVLSWTEAQQAQDLLAANNHLGKIVLEVRTTL